jgi:putative transposase
MTDDELAPRDHAEAVALFRAQVVGELVARQLQRGELEAELREKSQQRFRAPARCADSSRLVAPPLTPSVHSA